MPYVGGLFTGLKYVGALVDDEEDVSKLDEYLDLIVSANKQDGVVSIFMMPRRFYTDDSNPKTINFAVERPSTLNGYKPRNNKLLTYPYNFVNIDCINDCKEYRYELSGDDGTIHFMAYAGMSPNVEISCCPRNYNGSGKGDGELGICNFTEELVMTGFPQCAFAIDSFRAWVAQKATGDVLGVMGSLMGVASSYMMGNPAGMAGSVTSAVSIANNAMLSATKGATTRGNQGSSNLTAIRAKDFYIKYMCIRDDYAMIIDSYFDKYGYALGRITTPNRSSRPHWNYVKTKDCTLTGSIPADDMKKICGIYDSGVTFWKNPSEVGQYGLDNSPQ